MHIGSTEIAACKIVSCSLFGIGKSVVYRLISKLKCNNSNPNESHGKHLNRLNRIPEVFLFKINTHINSFPKRQSHYSRCDNLNVKYLSPELNISKMYKLYLKEYEPENFES